MLAEETNRERVKRGASLSGRDDESFAEHGLDRVAGTLGDLFDARPRVFTGGHRQRRRDTFRACARELRAWVDMQHLGSGDSVFLTSR